MRSDFVRGSIVFKRKGSDILQHYVSPYYDPEAASEYNAQYYQEHKTSTKGLNEAGRAVAKYGKAKITDDKNTKNDAAKAVKTSADETAKTTYETGKTQYDTLRDTNIAKYGETRDKTIEEARTLKETKITEHKTTMDSSIKSLQNKLSAMDTVTRKENAGTIRAEIAKLREEHRAFKEAEGITYKTTATEARDTYKTDATNMRGTHKTAVTGLRNTKSETLKGNRETYSTTKAANKTWADDEYAALLETIRANPEYLSSSGSSSSSSSSSSSGKNGMSYQEWKESKKK